MQLNIARGVAKYSDFGHIEGYILTRRPASADRTARRQFQATGQPMNRTQASDAMKSRLPRYEAECVQRTKEITMTMIP